MKRVFFSTIGAHNYRDGDREVDDFYATDPIAVSLLMDLEEFGKVITEPCCGMGHISETLVEYGKIVHSYDLIDRGYGITGDNFLDRKTAIEGDVITNPPYKYAEEFIRKCIELTQDGAKIAMFLKLQFLESKGRKKLFEEYPPKVIYVSSGRLRCAKGGDFANATGNAVCFCWYIWEKGYKGDTVVRWFN